MKNIVPRNPMLNLNTDNISLLSLQALNILSFVVLLVAAVVIVVILLLFKPAK